MPSIKTCIRKAGKSINKDDSKAIRKIYEELMQDGETPSSASSMAVTEYLRDLQKDQKALFKRIAVAGGDVSKLTGGLRYSIARKDSDISDKLSVRGVVDGKETIQGLSKKPTTRDLARALSSRAKSLNRGKPFSAKTARNKHILSEVIANETVAASLQAGDSSSWYSDTLRDALSIAEVMHPEIAFDYEAKNAFIFALAVTSNGSTVAENTANAELVYSQYKKDKTFPAVGFGKEASAMKKAFTLFNTLSDSWGMPNLVKFLHTEFTVAELNLLGLDVGGENKETVVFGSAIFGPKIGQSFFQNLSGNFDPLTMDRWWMRTWGRMVGNLAPEGMSAATSQADRLVSLLDSNEKKVLEKGFTVEQLEQSDESLLSFAKQIHAEYARGGFKDKSELNRAAKALDIASNEPVVAPRNGSERAWIREVVAAAQEKLKQRGFDIDVSSMQALLWYYEKNFYEQMGVGNAKSKPTDFAREFARLAESKGLDISGIESAISSGRARRTAAAVAVPEEAPNQTAAGQALSPKARKQLIQAAAVRTVRSAGKPAFSERVPKSAERKLINAPIAKVHGMGIKPKNTYSRSGLHTTDFFELERSEDSASAFRDSLSAARSASDAGKSVGLYALDEYEGMRLFLAPDRLSGFALKGDEIVSVFKHPKARNQPGVAQASIRLAVEQGGRTLNVLDLYTPHLYAMQGFKTVARIPWAAGPNPEGWNKSHFKSFNGGEPDFLYMVYDQNNFDPYAGEGVRVRNAKDAGKVQKAARDALAPRNDISRPLRYRLDDSSDPVVDRSPESPLSQLHKMAATVEDQIENGPADASAIKSSLGDMLLGKNARNLEHVLGAIPRRNLKDFVAEESMPSADAYIRVANRMDGRRNELLSNNEEIAKQWMSHIAKNKHQGRILGELMHAATLAGTDPAVEYRALKARENMTEADKVLDAKRRSDWALLRSWWNKLDSTSQGIYKSVQSSYIEQRKNVEAALENRILASAAEGKIKKAIISELRAKFEAGRVGGPYFPLSRFGDLWAVAKNTEGDVVAFSKFEKVSEQKEWVKGFREEGFEVDSGKKMEDMQLLNRVDPGFVSKVTEMAGDLDAGLADEIWQLYLRAMPEMSARKAFIHRKGRLGFSADAIRAYGHNMFHGAHQLSKLEHMHIMESHLDSMQNEARALEENDDPDALWGNAVFKEMVKRHAWARNPKASVMATKLTSLGFAWYLGVTPAAAMVNLSQTAIVGLPVLATKFNWLGASTELLKAGTLYAGSRGHIADKLRGEERTAMEEAQRIGLFDKTQAHDLAGLSEEGIDYTSKGRRTMEIISWLFHKAEEANRQVTFLAAYRLGRKKGMSHEDSILLSEDLVWDSHFDYNNVNRPRYLQNDAAKILLLFRQYSLNMTYRLARDFNDSIRAHAPEKRREARERMGGILMMTGLFGGLTSMPMIWAVQGVLDAVFGDDDEPFDSMVALRAHLTELYGAKAAEAIMKGPWDAMTGVTMSSRVSLSNLWLREAPANLEGDDLWLHYLGELAGPIPSIPKDYFQAYSLAREGHADRARERIMPKVAKDVLKAYRFLSEGVQNMRGDVIIPKENITARDAFYQAIGFTPAKLTMQYEQNRAVSTASSKIQKRRSILMDRLFLAARNDDKQGIRDAMVTINKFNRSNPSVAIGASNIIASARSRAKYSEGAVGGLTVSPKLRYLHNKLRFTPREGESE